MTRAKYSQAGDFRLTCGARMHKERESLQGIEVKETSWDKVSFLQGSVFARESTSPNVKRGTSTVSFESCHRRCLKANVSKRI